MLQMRLKSFNYFISLLIYFLFTSLLWAEDKIDIWNNKKETLSENSEKVEQNNSQNTNIISTQDTNSLEKIEIKEGSEIQSDEKKVYGIYEPANYNFSLNMWSNTKAEDLRSSLKRINKIKLSKSSKEILEIILLSISYPPVGMTDKEFVDFKINWLVKNDRIELIESFLKQNDEFESKSNAVQYLVDKRIASAIIK